jgi:hypothetical protein
MVLLAHAGDQVSLAWVSHFDNVEISAHVITLRQNGGTPDAVALSTLF